MNIKIQRLSHIPPHYLIMPRDMQTIHSPKEIGLIIGSRKKRMKVLFHEKLEKGTIGLSSHLYPDLTLPDQLPYQLELKNGTLQLGPIIGMIMARKEIKEDDFEELKLCLKNYEKIKGLVFICAESGINTQTKTIEGYYYDPEAAIKDEQPWKNGVFPYPGAIYRRVLLKDSIYYDLAKELRGKIFNSYLFNKYEVWNVLSKVPYIRPHLPNTVILREIESVNQMLNLHPSLYLKPIYGGYGLGILKLDKTLEGFRLHDSHEVDKLSPELGELEGDIQPLVERYYLVQQAVPLTYDHRQVDFRVILQKDKSQTWKSSGMLARYGRTERIYTNEVSKVTMGREALKEIFSLTEMKAGIIENKMVKLCVEAAIKLEKYYASYGMYGDLGIDVIVDHNQHIWLLEVNKFHEHDMALFVDSDDELYERIITTPLEYLKALAGFR